MSHQSAPFSLGLHFFDSIAWVWTTTTDPVGPAHRDGRRQVATRRDPCSNRKKKKEISPPPSSQRVFFAHRIRPARLSAEQTRRPARKKKKAKRLGRVESHDRPRSSVETDRNENAYTGPRCQNRQPGRFQKRVLRKEKENDMGKRHTKVAGKMQSMKKKKKSACLFFCLSTASSISL